jgi:hypothetical protein
MCFDLRRTRQKDNERTIEGLIFDALVKLGCVSEDNADDPVRILKLRTIWTILTNLRRRK